MSYTPKARSAAVGQYGRSGFKMSTEELSNDNPGPIIIILPDVPSKITYQCNGDLVGTIEFSANSQTWTTPEALSLDLKTFETHLVGSVRISRTSGTGSVAILGK